MKVFWGRVQWKGSVRAKTEYFRSFPLRQNPEVQLREHEMRCSLYAQTLHTRLQNSQSSEPFSECTVSLSHKSAWRVAFFFSSSGWCVGCEGRSTVFLAAGDLSSVTVGARRDSRDSFFSCNVTAFSGMLQKVIVLCSCAMELHQKTSAQRTDALKVGIR